MRKRNRGGALLLVLLLTLGGAWPAYAAEPETPPPAATEESGLPAPEPEEPPQPAPMISAVVTGFAGDGLPHGRIAVLERSQRCKQHEHGQRPPEKSEHIGLPLVRRSVRILCKNLKIIPEFQNFLLTNVYLCISILVQ